MNGLKRFVIDAAYYLNTSDVYQRRKRFFYNLLENDKYKYKKYFDLCMIALIFISVGVLIREVKFHVNDYLLFFNNYVISVIFLIEYLLRLWVNSSVTQIIIKRDEYDSLLGRDFNLLDVVGKIITLKLRYMLTVHALIDLLAIMPFFHELRLLRIFILFRVFKLFRYAKSFQTLVSVLATKKFEFITLLMFSSIVIFVSSVLIYVMEAHLPNSPIKTLYEAIYWSIVTISTVGYGDITPITPEGRFIAMIVITAGIAVLAFTTSLVVSAFTEKLDEIKEIKIIDDVSKLKRFYLICGYEDVAKEVAQRLIRHDGNIIVLDEDPQRVEHAKRDGLVALNYNPGSVESYEKLQIDMNTQIRAVLCLREDDIENVYTALTIRSIHKEVFMLSILMSDHNRKKLMYAGINEIIYPQELVGMITRELVGQPVAFKAIHELRSEQSNVNIHEIVVTERMLKYVGMVSELDNKRFRIVILGIYKKSNDRFYFNPIDSTLLELGDNILVIGFSLFIKEFEKNLYKKRKS